MTTAGAATPAASTTCPTSRAHGRSAYMQLARRKHAQSRPDSAALCIHCVACRLLRVTPWLRAHQIMLAASCDAIQYKERGFYMLRMTWHALTARPYRGRRCTCCSGFPRLPQIRRPPRACTSPPPPGGPAPTRPHPHRDSSPRYASLSATRPRHPW